MTTAADPPRYDFSVLRRLRAREGLTLQEVSRRSGVSAAVISRLERNQSQGELDTLFRLARVFGLSAAELLGLAEAPLAHRRATRTYRSGDFSFQRISYGNVDCFLGEAEPGATTSRPEIHHDDLEICWVLDGHLRLTLAHEAIDLRRGQSVQFDAIQSHTYQALAQTRLLILHLRKGKRL